MKRERASTDHTLMTLDPEFCKAIHRMIRQALQIYKIGGMSPKIDEVWQCSSPEDFKCGFFVGEMLSSSLNSFRLTYNREYTEEENNEIAELVEQNVKKIKKVFYKD